MDQFDKATILVVDDEPFLLSILCARLSGFGARILTAENGQQALDYVKAEQIDAVLTDIDMPVMTGLEFLSKIRELGYLTPVVILTGQGDQANMLTALRLGATDFLDKPFDSNVVNEVMQKALRLGMASRSMEEKLAASGGEPSQISLDEFRRWKTAVVANAASAPLPKPKYGR